MTWQPAGSEPAKLFAPSIDDPKINVGKADKPVAGFGFGKTNGLADQRLAEKDHLAVPADLAIAAHLAHLVIGIVPGRLNLIGIEPQRRPVTAGRRHLAEGRVRPVVIKVIPEAVKPHLLLGRRGGRRAPGLPLERGVHALVTAILLRRARLDSLQANAELDPMDRQPAAGAGARGKRAAIVAADGTRQTQLAKGLLDHWLHRLRRRGNNTALDQ